MSEAMRPGGESAHRRRAHASTTLVTLFQRQVRKTPHRTAVIAGNHRITYRQLDVRANKLARILVASGAGPEERVALLFDRSLDLIVALIATLKAGAAYLPLDPDAPPARLSALVADARPRLVLTTTALAHRLPAGDVSIRCVDAAEIVAMHDTVPSAAPTDDDRRAALRSSHPAYVIYTSGSTGAPKGVVVSHDNVVRLFDASRQWFSFDEHDTWTLFHACSFDFSVWEIWGALLHGGRLVIVPRDVARSAEAFRSLLSEHAVTVLSQTPSAFYRLMQADEDAGADAGPLALRTIIFGGEALDLRRLQSWHRRHGHAVRLVNMYGITETTVHVTCAPLDAETRPHNLIGVGLGDLELHVLDARLEPCAPHVVGELYVAGAGLARAYHGQPALTADRFVAHPRPTRPGERLYRSGDLAAWLDDGTLTYHGRADQQVKIRGFRIEPAEIEAVLLAQPAIGGAAVVARPASNGDARLVAYLVPRRERDGVRPSLDLHSVRQAVVDRLPDYMVPAAFEVLDALPLTPNGKLDRAALPEPEDSGLAATYVEPITPEERVLCELIATLLGVLRVGIDDHFFHLGGHSLLATRLTAQIRARFGRELPLRAVFDRPVVRDLARVVAGPLSEATVGLSPRLRPASLPASFAQARLWFLQQLEGASPAYHIPLATRFRGALNVTALEQALDDLRVRHEILRTVLESSDEATCQRILAAPPLSPALTVVPSTASDIDEDLAAAAARAFNLATDPPLRATLFRLTASEHVLLLLLHHSAADGWSVTPLLDDLSAAYRARCAGQVPAFAPLPVQYADYTLWQRERLGRNDDPASLGARQLAYWRERLAEIPDEIRLPADRPRTQSDSGGIVPFALSAVLHARLTTVARAHDATLFMLLEAALAAWLTRMGAGTDVPIGAPVAGRDDAALDHLVGFFVNTLVLRIDTSGNPTFAELLARVRTVCLDAYANQDVPFEWIVEALAPPRLPGRQPLFQTMLVVQNAPAPLVFPGVVTTPVVVHTGRTKFDLTVTFTETVDANGRPGGIEGTLEYRTDRFDEATAVRLAGRLTRLLEQAGENPAVPMHGMDLLEAAERRWLLEDVAPAAHDASQEGGRTVVERFEQQVARTPHRVALTSGAETVTYAELDARANRLAWLLLGHGVGPEDCVALVFNRSPELIVAILATLKSGAAFLPLDSDVPTARLHGLIADAGPRMVLTTRSLGERLATAPVAPCCVDAAEVIGALVDLPSTAATDADRPTALRTLHPAYVIYTSGSTGGPKGVVVSHGNLASYLDAVAPVLGDAAERMPLFTSAAFDLTITTFFAPLCGGGRIDIVSAAHPADAVASLVGPGAMATAVKLTPAHLALLPEPTGERGLLRTVIVGGEALTPAHVTTLRAHGPDIRVFNEYGPTETTVGATGAWVTPDDVSIGRPYAHLRAYVLDAGMQPCPVNVPGELYLAGLGLARGYLRRPALTAERFVAHPFATTPGERLYRTGDLVAWRPDGALEYLGRIDHQLKIRGVRVEPGEIESALLGDAALSQAAVAARSDASGTFQLVAYLVPRVRGEGRPAIDLDAVRRRLDALLPDALVPAAFVVLDALPLTRNGKVDRAALPAPDASGVLTGYVAPTTNEGAVLCEVTASLLGLPCVGLADHFFRLGGHSLLATRLVAQLRARLRRDVPLRTVFESPGMEALARALQALPIVDPVTALAPDPAVAHEPFPLTPVQEAYWLGRQGLVALGDVACHVYMELRLAALDVPAFEDAWQEAIDRHPMLRAVIDADGTQRILRDVQPFSLPCADWSAASGAEGAAAALKIRDELSHQIRPAEIWPLFDVRVTRVAAADWRVHLSVDALILDGESLARLLHEIFDRYERRLSEPRARGESPLPPSAASPVTFRDYVVHVQQEPADGAHDYWKARLDGLPPAPALPVAADPSRLTGIRFQRHHAWLAPDVWNSLRSRAAAAGLTPAAVLMTAYAEVIGTWARSDDFTLNITVADRRALHPAVATMLGVFTNLTPLEVRGACRGSLVDRAHAQLKQLSCDLDHRAVSGVEVQRWLAQRAGDPQAGLLPVVFTSMLGETAAMLPDGVDVVYSITQTPQTWLDNKVYEANGGLGIDWDSPDALFAPGLLDAMCAAYVDLLRQLADSDAAWTATDRSLVPAADCALVDRMNDTAGPIPDDRLHDPVFVAAAVTPDAPAVITDNGTLSFRELAHRAGALARELTSRLQSADELIAIVMEKGVEQIVAALAILEAGRAFLPISADQPDARIATILRQAGVRVALVQDESASHRPASPAVAPRTWTDGMVCLSVPSERPTGPPSSRLRQTAMPDDVAYVIYTSGSSGVPKGVTITHRAARNTLADLTERFDVGATDRVLWVSSLAFDLSIFDIFGLLGAGGAVVVPPPHGQREPRGWMERIHRHGVTIWDSVPALAELALTGPMRSRSLAAFVS